MPHGPLRRLARRILGWVISDEPPETFWKYPGVSAPTASGVSVTDDSALRITAVLSCVKVIAETISTLPLRVFEKQANGDRRLADEHPLDHVLQIEANDEITAQSLRETLCAHVLLRGNARAQVVRDGGGDVREIWPLLPAQCREYRETPGGPLLVEVNEPGVKPRTLRPGQVWRIPGLSWNGVTGLSPIGLCRESMGLSLVLEQAQAAFMKNGARIAGVVTHPAVMEDPEYQRFKESWDAAYAGAVNAGKTVILEAGAKFEKVGMNLDDAQFIDQRKFQVAEIARIFRVPLHMLGDTTAQPRANMEQAALEFVQNTLRPWLVRFEATISRDLLLPSERGRYYARHNLNALLRGDLAARAQFYGQMLDRGVYDLDEVRGLEELNALPNGLGKHRVRPGNLVPVGTPAPASPGTTPPPPKETAA